MWVWLILVSSFVGLYIHFSKKLLVLLILELCFVSVIFLYFFLSTGVSSLSSFPSMMVFLGFMVMDSVLGLCSLLLSSRNSTSFMDSFFGC